MINLVQLVKDVVLWLPDSNVLSEVEIINITKNLITQIGDKEENYPEILCKSLRLVANLNLVKGSGELSGIKREKSDDVEYEYFENKTQDWKDYIKSLKDICPLFGYNGLSASGNIKINPSPVKIGLFNNSELPTL